MNQILAENLYVAFPYIYRGRHKSKFESAMCWGIECGDGWYQILYDLSQQLEDHRAKHPALDFEVFQVKSKMGRLRFHLNWPVAVVVSDIVSSACSRADTICELCGKSGLLYSNTLIAPIMVLCDEDAVKLRLTGSDRTVADGHHT